MERYADIPKDKLAARPMVIEGPSNEEYISMRTMVDQMEKWLRRRHVYAKPRPQIFDNKYFGYLVDVHELGMQVGLSWDPEAEYQLRLHGHFDNIEGTEEEGLWGEQFQNERIPSWDEEAALEELYSLAEAIGVNDLERGHRINHSEELESYFAEVLYDVGAPNTVRVMVIPSELWRHIPQAVRDHSRHWMVEGS